MKREVERERKIPAFSIGIAELEVLWGRLLALFENGVKIYSSIDVRLPRETLEFSDIEELKQYPNLKGKIRDFSLTLSHKGRRISIRSSGFFQAQAVVRTTAETEAWCAGAIETTYSFLQSHKVWYHWFVSAPIGWILIFLANIPTAVALILPKGSTINKTAYIGWLATLVALGILYVFRKKLFPAAAIHITDEEGFVRRHSAELSLIIALLSAVLTEVAPPV